MANKIREHYAFEAIKSYGDITSSYDSNTKCGYDRDYYYYKPLTITSVGEIGNGNIIGDVNLSLGNLSTTQNGLVIMRPDYRDPNSSGNWNVFLQGDGNSESTEDIMGNGIYASLNQMTGDNPPNCSTLFPNVTRSSYGDSTYAKQSISTGLTTLEFFHEQKIPVKNLSYEVFSGSGEYVISTLKDVTNCLWNKEHKLYNKYPEYDDLRNSINPKISVTMNDAPINLDQFKSNNAEEWNTLKEHTNFLLVGNTNSSKWNPPNQIYQNAVQLYKDGFNVKYLNCPQNGHTEIDEWSKNHGISAYFSGYQDNLNLDGAQIYIFCTEEEYNNLSEEEKKNYVWDDMNKIAYRISTDPRDLLDIPNIDSTTIDIEKMLSSGETIVNDRQFIENFANKMIACINRLTEITINTKSVSNDPTGIIDLINGCTTNLNSMIESLSDKASQESAAINSYSEVIYRNDIEMGKISENDKSVEITK